MALVVLPACVVFGGGGSLREAPEEVGSGQVGLEVFEDGGSGRLLLVPVHIGDAGPYQFILDTGASRSIVDAGIVEELGLSTGPSAQARSISSQFQGRAVELDGWRVGNVSLQPRTIVSTELPETEREPQFQGLLGSDVLAAFGDVTIDYEQQILTLRGGD